MFFVFLVGGHRLGSGRRPSVYCCPEALFCMQGASPVFGKAAADDDGGISDSGIMLPNPAQRPGFPNLFLSENPGNGLLNSGLRPARARELASVDQAFQDVTHSSPETKFAQNGTADNKVSRRVWDGQGAGAQSSQ